MAKMNDNQPPVIKALHDLIVAWVRHVEHIPRMHRHTLGARVTESLLDAQMHVFHAQPLDDRLQRIETAQASISLAKYTLRVLVDIQALPKMLPRLVRSIGGEKVGTKVVEGVGPFLVALPAAFGSKNGGCKVASKEPDAWVGSMKKANPEGLAL